MSWSSARHLIKETTSDLQKELEKNKCALIPRKNILDGKQSSFGHWTRWARHPCPGKGSWWHLGRVGRAGWAQIFTQHAPFSLPAPPKWIGRPRVEGGIGDVSSALQKPPPSRTRPETSIFLQFLHLPSRGPTCSTRAPCFVPGRIRPRKLDRNAQTGWERQGRWKAPTLLWYARRLDPSVLAF